MGCFCLGKCNRQGVSVAVNDEVHTGITKENFEAFFQNEIIAKIEG
jgi:NADH:ubiquinone oxidoreductase subunit E